MFGAKVTVDNKVERIRKAKERAAKGNFRAIAFLVQQTAVGSIERAEGPSDPPNPPHTHRGSWFRRAIRYWADKMGAIIGPMFSVVGTVGQAHEFGGEYRGQRYSKRETMLPAMEQNIEPFANMWSGSISA